MEIGYLRVRGSRTGASPPRVLVPLGAARSARAWLASALASMSISPMPLASADEAHQSDACRPDARCFFSNIFFANIFQWLSFWVVSSCLVSEAMNLTQRLCPQDKTIRRDVM